MRLKNNIFLVLLIWIVGAIGTSKLSAQNVDPFRIISHKDGLSNDFIQCLYQDRKGFIWVGTENGLNRYDGYQFIVFKEDPAIEKSLKGNWINDIFEDSQNNLWAGTNKGLNLINQETLEIELIELFTDSQSTEIAHVIVIQEDKEGRLWLGTTHGLKSLILKDEKWEVGHHILTSGKDAQSSYELESLVIDENGYIWTAIGSTLYRYNPQTKKSETITIDHPIPVTNITDVLRIDPNGKIIFGTHRVGIYRIEQPASTPLINDYSHFFHDPKDPNSFSQNRIVDLWVAENDWVWAATQRGLFHINLTTEEIVPFVHNPLRKGSLSSDLTSQVLLDKNQNLWVGTIGGGLNLLPNRTTPFTNYSLRPNDPTTLSHNHVRSLLTDDAGFLWVGTLGKGLDKMRFTADKGWVKVKNWGKNPADPNGLQSNDIIHMIKTRKGKIIMGTVGKALFQMDPVTEQLTAYKQQPGDVFDYDGIWALCEDRHGNIWMGTRKQGVHKLNLETGELKSYSSDSLWTSTVANKFIFDIYVDKQGNIWIGSVGGLYQFNPEKNEMREFLNDPTDLQSISDFWIWSIKEDSKGVIWIGTNQGLNQYDSKTGDFLRFYEQDGLPSNVILGILEDNDKNLWISTDAGLARQLPPTGDDSNNQREKSFRSYTFQSGLSENVFVAHAYFQDTIKGQLYFGGTKGFDVVNTHEIKMDTSQPQMILASMSIQNQTKDKESVRLDPFISSKDKVELSYLDDVLTFTFSDFNFQDSDANVFEYQLIGLSEQWIPLRENKTMTFIDLEPGKYALNMRGINADGFVIKPQTLLEMHVRPPWWKSTLAYAFYWMGLLGLFTFLIRYELNRRHHKYQAELERARAEEKQKQAENLNKKNEEILAVQEQLIQAEKMASLGQMTAGLAHEIKNPLNFVNNFARNVHKLAKELVEELPDLKEKLEPESYEDIEEMLEMVKTGSNSIEKNGIRADNIVSSMMLHMSNSSGERRLTDLNQLVKENTLLAYHGFQAQGFEGEIEFQQKLDHTLPQLSIQPQEFSRALLNIVNNACETVAEKMGEKGYVPLIQIETGTENKKIVIRISDNGLGISPKQKDKLFDPFFTTKPTGKGNVGLGLSISYDIIVKGHQGKIEVESEDGKGTTIEIQLPIG